MLGSDYPFPLGEHHPGKLIESVQEMDEELKVKLCTSSLYLHVKIYTMYILLCTCICTCT